MKKVIQFLFLLAIGAFGVNHATLAMPTLKDSVIVKVKDNTLVLYGNNSADFKGILQYDLNAIFADLLKEMESSPGTHKITYEDLNGSKYRLEGEHKEGFSIKVIQQGKEGNEAREIRIDTVISDKQTYRIIVGDETAKEADSLKLKKYYNHRSKSGSPRQGFNINLGLNNITQNNHGAYTPSDYDLRPFGSRFVALGATRSARLVKGKNASFFLDFGIDFSWHNLMFDNNNTVIRKPDGIAFEPLLNSEGRELSLSKSKLTIPHVNLSLMPTLSIRRSFISYISAGVYGGYRIGGYTKTKISDTGNKNRIKDNYYMNDFRYGLAFELGIKNFPALFFNYDMNSVFEESKGPHIQMLSFGVRI